MRYVEWIVMFVVAGLGIALANFVGFQVSFMDSLPGIAILLLISLAAVVVSKVVPIKLPVIAYCSLIGLLGLPAVSGAGVCHRGGGKDQFYCASYHGWGLCGNLHQRQAEGVCASGLENASDRGSCYGGNLCGFRHHFSDNLIFDKCNLKAVCYEQQNQL